MSDNGAGGSEWHPTCGNVDVVARGLRRIAARATVASMPDAARMSGDLAAFLLARIADDEAGARVARENDIAEMMTHTWLGVPLYERFFRECEAKRQIVELHPLVMPDDWPEANPPACGTCRPLLTPYPCDTLRLLAAPYADHPDYREEWRP